MRTQSITLLVAIGTMGACDSEQDVTKYSIIPGWYKVEGTNTVHLVSNEKITEVLREDKIDNFACITEENSPRKSKAELMRDVATAGQNIIDIEIKPYRDYMKLAVPPNEEVSNLVSVTTVDYSLDLKVLKSTVDGTGDTQNGKLVTNFQSVSTWLGPDCFEANTIQNMNGSVSY